MRRAAFAFYFLLSAAASVCAQAISPVPSAPSTGPRIRSIVGTVTDIKGAAVPGAVVLLKDLKTLQIRSFIAENGGQYHFFGLSTDVNYQVRAESDDMTSRTKNISVFDSHSRIKVNLKLKKKKKKGDYA